eukprot:64884-Chlamydomonas_euryale.AAC.1
MRQQQLRDGWRHIRVGGGEARKPAVQRAPHGRLLRQSAPLTPVARPRPPSWLSSAAPPPWLHPAWLDPSWLGPAPAQPNAELLPTVPPPTAPPPAVPHAVPPAAAAS